MELRVALIPLLSQRVEIGRLKIDGLSATLRPATSTPPSKPAGGDSPAASNSAGALLIPHLELTEARVVMTGPDGTNTLSGLELTGAFRQSGATGHFEGDARAAALEMVSARDAGRTTLATLSARLTFDGGAAGGTLAGDAAADSLILLLAPAPGATQPARPLRLPGPRAKFEATLHFGAAPDAQIRLADGRLGPLPFSGTVRSHQVVPTPDWKSAGDITLAAISLDSLKTLLPAEALAPLKAYALGGRCEGARSISKAAPAATVSITRSRHAFRPSRPRCRTRGASSTTGRWMSRCCPRGRRCPATCAPAVRTCS